jgi:hypothetical protein
MYYKVALQLSMLGDKLQKIVCIFNNHIKSEEPKMLLPRDRRHDILNRYSEINKIIQISNSQGKSEVQNQTVIWIETFICRRTM